MTSQPSSRDIVFISKATPEDDEFVMWLAPKLEAAGYRVFADILNLEAGERWRKTLTKTLQTRAIKMILLCTDIGLDKDGVQEEIGIATDVSREIDDPKFILPIRLKRFKRVFGIGELQYINFEKSWADGLAELLDTLDAQGVPKLETPVIQPQWEQYRRRDEVTIDEEPETLTSNWARIAEAPDKIAYIAPKGRVDRAKLMKRARSFKLPLVEHWTGFVTFCAPHDMEEHFEGFGELTTVATINLDTFLEKGWSDYSIRRNEARDKLVSLLRQAWECHLTNRGFKTYEYASGLGHHVSADQIGLNKRIAWGPKETKRRSVMRNVAKKRVWEYGLSATPNLYPIPHFRLKARVLFSELKENPKENEDKVGKLIQDKDQQHKYRRSTCSAWRNKAWHGRLMGFLELLAGEDPVIALPVGAGGHIVLDASPINLTSPVTTGFVDDDEDGEETDTTTLTGPFEEDEEGAS